MKTVHKYKDPTILDQALEIAEEVSFYPKKVGFTKEEITKAYDELRDSALNLHSLQAKESSIKAAVIAAHKRVSLAREAVREITGY